MKMLSGLVKIYGLKVIKIEKQNKNIHSDVRKIKDELMDVRGYSLAEVCRLREEYSRENNIKYDFFMFIRPDILCVQPLILNNYIDKVLKDGFFTLVASNVFRRQTAFGNSVISDPRFYDECDLIWISNYGDADFWGRFTSSSYRFNRNDLSMNVPIMIDYRFGRDFFILRSASTKEDYIPFREIDGKEYKELCDNLERIELVTKELDSTKQQLDFKVKELESKSKEIQSLKQSLDSLPIRKQTLEIKNLEQDNLLKQIQIQEAKQELINKQLHTKKLEKELEYESNVLKELESKNQELTQTKNQLDSTKKELELKNKQLESANKILSSNPNPSHLIQNTSNFKGKLAYLNTLTTAKDRIHNHLSYKLGKAMIENSKSILGYIRMPYVLSYIKEQHNKEQKQYQEQIKKNPNLKLPKLESYKDYKEALKEKECFTYKLGEALMKADKTWLGGGGYIKLRFEIRKLKREFRKKELK